MKPIDSQSEEQTKAIARELGKKVKIPAIIGLYGELGSGKTVFTKGFAEGLGIAEKNIKSPTYTFVREYRHGRIRFYHFDFYRISELDDLMAHELREIFQKKDVCIIIEWPERVHSILPEKVQKIFFEYRNEKTRRLVFHDD